MIWPEVITNPSFEFGPKTKESQAAACADGLMAWGCCVLEKSPENFGHGLVKIMHHLELQSAPTSDNLMKYAKRFTRPLGFFSF